MQQALAMALPLAFAVAALACLAAPAAAQAPSPALQVEGAFADGSVAAPGMTTLKLTVTRLCPNAAVLLSAQRATLQYDVPDGIHVEGGAAVDLPQQVCAQTPSAAATTEAQVHVTEGAAAGLASLHVRAATGGNGALEPASTADADVALTVVRPTTGPASDGAGAPVEPAPLPAQAFVLLALLGVAVVARRQRS